MLEEKFRSCVFSILKAAALLMLANAVMAQSLTGSRYPISAGDVTRALGIVDVSVDASQVHLPAHMSAAIASPKLEIVMAQPLGDNQVRIELRCSAAGECLPFFATVDVKDANLVSSNIRLKTASATSPNHQAATRIGGESVSRPRLTVGSRAVLLIQDGHLQIHLQVLAIDSGAIGQQVRVCTMDRKKVFHATVTGEGTVSGVME